MYNPRLGLLDHMATLFLVFWGTSILLWKAFYEEWFIQGTGKRPNVPMTTFMVCYQPHLAGLLQEKQLRETSNWPLPLSLILSLCPFSTKASGHQTEHVSARPTGRQQTPWACCWPTATGTSQLCISNRPSASPTPDQGAQASSDPQSNKQQFLSFPLVSFYVLGARGQGTHLLQASQSGLGVQKHREHRKAQWAQSFSWFTPNNPQIRPKSQNSPISILKRENTDKSWINR